MVAATDIGFVRMRVSKVVGLNDGDRVGEFVVEDSDQRQEGDSAEAVLMRRALTARPMTITKAGP
jgi:hypothetical protein